MSIFVGEVTAVNGIQITLTVDETSNKGKRLANHT